MEAWTTAATRRFAWRATALLALCLAACGPPSRGTAGAPPPAPLLYVANAQDGTISRVDSATGRAVGAPLPAGPAPWQIAVGANGSVLVLAAESSMRSTLTYVAPSAGLWKARPLVVEPGAQQMLLAGDGRRYAAMAYAVEAFDAHGIAARCRLALVDLRTGAVVRRYSPCAGQESITSIALETTSAGTTTYVGISAWHEAEGRQWRDRNGQILALDAETGIPWAAYPMAGWPRKLFVAPAPGGLARRLYCLAVVPGANWDDHEDEDSWLASSGGQLRLQALDPGLLVPLGSHELSFLPSSLAVAPDGKHAYALTAMGSQVIHIDLASGAATPLVWFHALDAGDLAADDTRLYVANRLGSELWMLDRRHGRLLKTVPVGRHPVGIVAANADRS